MPLHTHVFGPPAIGLPDEVSAPTTPAQNTPTPTVLALHGLTGHGRRWEALATEHLADVRILAPDLLGHGHSAFEPPWTIAENVAHLLAVLNTHLPPTAPLVLLGHSFGSAVALELAQTLASTPRAGTLGGIVLLDPAQGLEPAWAQQLATDTLMNWGYSDADAARAAKRAEGWSQVPEALLDKEIEVHLIDIGGGRVGWRVSAPATAVAWSEMTRDLRLPPRGVPTSVVVAQRVQPPFVTDAFRTACAAQRSDTVTFIDADCEHMVPFIEPELTARLVRSMIEGR